MFFKKHICGQCGRKVNARLEQKGNLLILIILLLLFIVPGIIYFIWMVSGRRYVCPKCKSYDVVKIKSPRGYKLMQDFGYVRRNTS